MDVFLYWSVRKKKNLFSDITSVSSFLEDNLWYRAAVTAYASEDTVLVDYMDYGNSDSLPLTRLRPIIPSLMDLPAQAIRCSLAGMKVSN